MHFVKMSNPVALEYCYSLFWNKDDLTVEFGPVIDLIRECNLTIVDMAYRSAASSFDDRCMMKFKLLGVFQNFELFELKCYQNPKLAQFIDSN